eukprot:GGOE01009905.1.p4 GENE.GGOE01009905.1~~GGOE01009905.1.p4  ORF type:complete len:102 (+),score=5.48 GGOE01009905.1:221-526(+)
MCVCDVCLDIGAVLHCIASYAGSAECTTVDGSSPYLCQALPSSICMTPDRMRCSVHTSYAAAAILQPCSASAPTSPSHLGGTRGMLFLPSPMVVSFAPGTQ